MLIYLAFFIALKNANVSYMVIALILGLIGIAVYFPSNPAFEMLSLSSQYAAAAILLARQLLI